MSKYVLLAIVALLAGLSIRYQSDKVAKAMYVEGCLDTTIKIAQTGDVKMSAYITRFCTARKSALDQYFGAFQ